jgi:hypothetical protein
MLKLTFYVPEDAAEAVKDALFNAGAGAIGNYDRCSFETQGVGQFRALPGANPTIGKIGNIEKISEVRVEMVVDDAIIKNVIAALKNSHPYETPAYDVIKCLEL